MKRNLYAFIIILALMVGACSMPSLAGSSPVPAATTVLPGSPNPALPATAAAVAITSTTIPPVSFSTLTPTVSGDMPGEPGGVVAATKDEVFPSTTGDAFSINRYERPFQLDNTYRPDADIAATFINDTGEWYYFSSEVVDIHPETKLMDSPFGFEIDFDRDGRGDYLLWATPPFSSTWTDTNVQVYADTNRDVGNRRPMLSDAPSTLTSNGYETAVVLNGGGSAWARQSPTSPTTLQIAVKKTLINQASFLFWGWTDFDLSKAAAFDYNDVFTSQQAGSPYASDPNYPLKALYGMDNTCRVAYGFTPVGNEPGLCGGVKPVSTIKVVPTVGTLKTAIPGIKPTNTPTVFIKVITDTPTLPPPPPPVCNEVQVGAKVTDGSTWDPSWASGVTLCVGGDCKNPDSNGYAFWYLPAGVYTIKASSTFGITPDSATVKLGCGEKSQSQFVIGPG